MHASRLPNLVRGSFAATIATFVALVSHVAGGGAVPGIAGWATPLILSLLICVALAGRNLSVIRLSVSVVASQVLFHTLFMLGTPSAALQGGASAGAGAAMPQHHDHAAMMMIPPPALSPGTAELVQADPTMWLAHALGAAVTVIFLVRGERTLERLRAIATRIAAWVRIGFDAPWAQPVALHRPRVLPAEFRHRTLLSLIQTTVQCRRGPPVHLFAAR
ncbi:hypothetical protein MUN76_10345 [Leucobacter rhizosphaerae]|uniref:Integral membrane protein n=1 Tax=Leucobacter rhizosphaerae TaxID=2932245 RepID=A0ABY4FT76_9MICO|nr:hypothetical protein [Leucobacter rhizosphaerae]UOQ59452.1 hypothetical protein MUN76_10345 [Leucobacter rhizosphaerae]